MVMFKSLYLDESTVPSAQDLPRSAEARPPNGLQRGEIPGSRHKDRTPCFQGFRGVIHRCWAVYNTLFWCFLKDDMLFCRTSSAIFAYLYLTSTKLSKLSNCCWLVVWTIFYFPYIGNVIIPTDELHDFSEGRAQPPTS